VLPSQFAQQGPVAAVGIWTLPNWIALSGTKAAPTVAASSLTQSASAY
jgi:hypothetical protein